MITRKKAIIIITGSKQEDVMRILSNHEALVQIYKTEEIEGIWSKNKTPIVAERDFSQVCRRYEGDFFVFDTEEQGITEVNQKDVTEKITKFCYKEKIEPGEFKVKNTANNSSEGCFFCEITKHPGMTTYTYNLQCKLVDMIIYESPNFVVVPALGPLTPGYLMIMTKDHYLSLAQVPEYLRKEYSEVESDIEEMLRKMYNKDIGFYEHGTGAQGAVGLKSIVHMHVHVMVDSELKEEYRNMVSMRRVSDISVVKDVSYFSYKWGKDGEQWVTDDPEVYIQRQFQRQVYAEENNLAMDQFNWRKTPLEDKTKTNVWQLFDYLSRGVDNPRIAARTTDFVKAARCRFK